jgi:phosphohistidine phosphatase
VIVSSPLVRALQTAEIVAAMTGAEVEVRRELSPEGEALPLIRERIAARARRLMLVGHEPDLADLAAHLAGRAFPAGLQKGMVVGFGVDADSADPSAAATRVRFVLDPKSLAWLDDAR